MVTQVKINDSHLHKLGLGVKVLIIELQGLKNRMKIDKMYTFSPSDLEEMVVEKSEQCILICHTISQEYYFSDFLNILAKGI